MEVLILTRKLRCSNMYLVMSTVIMHAELNSEKGITATPNLKVSNSLISLALSLECVAKESPLPSRGNGMPNNRRGKQGAA